MDVRELNPATVAETATINVHHRMAVVKVYRAPGGRLWLWRTRDAGAATEAGFSGYFMLEAWNKNKWYGPMLENKFNDRLVRVGGAL